MMSKSKTSHDTNKITDGLKQNNSKSSIVLGTHENSYETTKRCFDFSAAGQTRPPQLTQNVKDELRAAHFILGDDKTEYATSNCFSTTGIENYCQIKQAHPTCRAQRGPSAAMATAQNIVMGTDRVEYEAQSHRALKWDVKNFAQAQEIRKEGSQLRKETRQSHLVLGEDPVTYTATTAAHYLQNHSKAQRNVLDKASMDNLRATHFKLGSDKVEYRTSNGEAGSSGETKHLQLDKKKSCAEEDSLSGSHLSFGNEPSSYATTSQLSNTWDASFRNATLDNKEQARRIAQGPRTSSIKFGNHLSSYETTTKSAFKSSNHQSLDCYLRANGIEEDGSGDISHLHLGCDVLDYATSSHQQDTTGIVHKYSAKLSETARKGLRSSNIVLGHDETRNYNTCNNSNVEITGESGHCRTENRAKLPSFKPGSSGNIILGDENNSYLTTAGKDYVYDSGIIKRNDMDPEMHQDLRSSHFTLGTDTLTYSSSNQLPDPTGSILQYRALLNEEQRALLFRSSVRLGDDDPQRI